MGECLLVRRAGGLSNAKLSLATASIADVLAGKTFYAGRKELKTGALNKGYKMVTGSLKFDSAEKAMVSCGFRPDVVVVYNQDTRSPVTVFVYVLGETYGAQSSISGYYQDVFNSGGIPRNSFITVNATGFTVYNPLCRNMSAAWYFFYGGGDCKYYAFGKD